MSVLGCTTCVVMPLYNEEETVVKCVERVLQESYIDFINVVDDGSTDQSWECIQSLKNNPRVRLIKQSKNQGKGAALREGFKHCKEDIVAVQDADLEYSPSDLKKLFEEVASKRHNIAYGSRYLGRDHYLHSSVLFYLGGQAVTIAANILYGCKLTDEPTCYKVFRRDLLDKMNLRCMKFEFCPEFTAKACLLKEVIHEMPISYHPRHWEAGKKITAKDGFEAIWELLYWRFKGIH